MLLKKVVYFILFLTILPVEVLAAGISVDAGLTPAEDRWMFRTQFRYMKRNDDPTSNSREMDRYIWNNVLAYGVRPDLTLILKQPIIYREMTISSVTNEDRGFADTTIIAKYRVYRKNTPNYTLGVASTLGLELPTGANAFTSETWDLIPGLYASWRTSSWSSDFSFSYAWNGFSDDGIGGKNPGDELSLDWALAYQITLGNNAEMSLFPVVELSYKKISKDSLNGSNVANTGESVLYVSPGVKFAKSSFIIESLIQIPVTQDQEGIQLKRGFGSIIGIRYLF